MKLTTLEMFVLHKDGVPIRVLAEKTGRDPKDVKNELRRYVAAERRRQRRPLLAQPYREP